MEDWHHYKAIAPNGQLPYIKFEDGTKMHQSSAIMRWLGGVYGYIPEEEDLKAQMDVFIEDYHDAYAKF
jgi:glutathione S-transferase